MQIKGLQKIIKLCDRIGLKTLKDLERFYKEEVEQGEAVTATLQRYVNNLPKYFRIKKDK